MTDLEAAKEIASTMATGITDTGAGFIAAFDSQTTAQAYMSAISTLNVAAVRSGNSVTVTNP